MKANRKISKELDILRIRNQLRQTKVCLGILLDKPFLVISRQLAKQTLSSSENESSSSMNE